MNEYYEYFGPNYRLDVPQNNTEDLNTPEYLDKIKTQVFENLRHTGGGGGAPSVQMQREWSPLILSRDRCPMLHARCIEADGCLRTGSVCSHPEDAAGRRRRCRRGRAGSERPKAP